MGERDFELNGVSFQLNKIDPFKQFHIVRKLAPILSKLTEEMKALKRSGDKDLTEDEQLDVFARVATPIMMGLSELSEKDSEEVLHALLASVEMKQAAGNWARVSNGKIMLFQDLDLPMLLQIAGKAFMYNLSGFFNGLPRKS